MSKKKPQEAPEPEPFVDPEAEELAQLEEELAAEEAAKAATEEAPAPEGPTLLLEDGRRVPFKKQQDRPQFREYGPQFEVYDHCAETPEGEWIYRRVE